MWTKVQPWKGWHDVAIGLAVGRGDRPVRPSPSQCEGEELPETLWHFIEECWCQEASRRPPMIEVAAYFAPSRVLVGQDPLSRWRGIDIGNIDMDALMENDDKASQRRLETEALKGQSARQVMNALHKVE
jgi:hypothetical protein